jgi:hypothetical protein
VPKPIALALDHPPTEVKSSGVDSEDEHPSSLNV